MTPPSPDTFATFLRTFAVWLATFLWLVLFFVPASPLVIGCCFLPARYRRSPATIRYLPPGVGTTSKGCRKP